MLPKGKILGLESVASVLWKGEGLWIIGIHPAKGCSRYFPLDPQQCVQYKWSCSRMLTKYRLLLQCGRREDDRWRRLVQTEISCLRARVWRSAPAGWLDAHTNPQLHLSDAKDHLGARTCRGGAGKWFMPPSSGLRWSQRKQLQWRWYIPSVCMWLREGWGQRRIIIQSWDLSPECLYARFMVSLMGKTAVIQYGEEPRYRETPAGPMMEHNHAALRDLSPGQTLQQCNVALRVTNLTCNYNK